jgi:hypothetical protein
VIAVGGGWVLLRGTALAETARLARFGADVLERRDGITSVGVETLLGVLEREGRMSAPGPTEVPQPLPVASSAVSDELVTASEVASMIGCTPRHVRRIAAQLGGFRVGDRWAFHRDQVAASAAGRQEEVA